MLEGMAKLHFILPEGKKKVGRWSKPSILFLSSSEMKFAAVNYLINAPLCQCISISTSFHWVKSLYVHYIEFCHNKLICFSAIAVLGLSYVSKQLVFAWFAASQGVKRRWLCRCQDSCCNIQTQLRIVLVFVDFWYTVARLTWLNGGKENGFIFHEIKYKPGSRLSYKQSWAKKCLFQLHFWADNDMFLLFNTFNILCWPLCIYDCLTKQFF